MTRLVGTSVLLFALVLPPASVALAAEPPADGTGSAARYVLLDEGGETLPGATVTLVGRSGSVVTDDDGAFVLDPAPPPPFRLVVFEATGALVGSISVDGSEGDRLTLVRARVETVQVAIGVAPTTLAPPAAAPSVVSREENEQRNPVRLVDALDEVPGAGQSGSGAAAVPTLRGLAQGRSLILIDDARVTAERRAGPSATYLNPLSLENVEVVRGPGSVAYGSDAIGGIIHARTPLPDPSAPSGRFEIGAGAGIKYGTVALEGNVPIGTAGLLVQAHGREYGDYESPDGTVVNSGARFGGVLLRGLVPVGGGRLTAGLQIDRGREIGRPDTRVEDRLTVQPEENSERLTVGWQRHGWGGFSSVGMHAFLGGYSLATEREDFGDDTLSRSEVDAKDASLRFVGERGAASGSLRIGADVTSRFDLHSTDAQWADVSGGDPTVLFAEVTIESADKLDVGLFAEGEWKVGDGGVTLAGGLRGDYVTTRNSGGTFGDLSTTESAPSGFGAVRWKPGSSGLEFSAQIARGFRVPRLSDLYFQGTTARGTITGNPELVPETSRQIDLALRKTGERSALAAYGFYYRIDDLIQRYLADPATRLFAFRNRGEQELAGFELEADIDLARAWSARGTLTFIRGRMLDEPSGPDDSPYPDDVPPPTITLSVNNRATARLWWRAEVMLVARDDRPGPTEIATPGYWLLNASAGYAFAGWGEVRLVLKNIADLTYPSSSDDVAPLAPGRNVALILAGRF